MSAADDVKAAAGQRIAAGYDITDAGIRYPFQTEIA